MDRRTRRPRLARVGLAIVGMLVVAVCFGPGPHAHGAGAPAAVTDGGPTPGVLLYVGEPAGSQRRSPPTGHHGIGVQIVETGENAPHNCPPRARPRSGPASRSRADYASSG